MERYEDIDYLILFFEFAHEEDVVFPEGVWKAHMEYLAIPS